MLKGVTSNVSVLGKISGPKSVTDLKWAPIFEWRVVRFGSKYGHQKDMFKSNWTACITFGNQSRLNTQQNWVNLYDHLMRKRILTLTVNKIFMRSENSEENGCRHNLDFLITFITFTIVIICTLQEVDEVLNRVHLRPIYHKALPIASRCSF